MLADEIPSLQKLILELGSEIESLDLREEFIVPDLAMAMLAAQVHLLCRGVLVLQDQALPACALPVARAAFETGQDVLFLALSTTDDEYALLGAQAAMGADLDLDEIHDSAESAGGAIQVAFTRRPRTANDSASVLSDGWKEAYPQADSVIHTALQTLRNRRAQGQKHWTGLSRQTLHHRVAARLKDGSLGPMFTSTYVILTKRTHPGLHTSVVERVGERIVLDDSKRHPEDSSWANTGATIAALSAIHACRERFEPD
jgi:hypothetical protein